LAANTDREHLLRSLPAQLGYPGAPELIAALEQAFGLPSSRSSEHSQAQDKPPPSPPNPGEESGTAARAPATPLAPDDNASAERDEVSAVIPYAAQVIHAVINRRLGPVLSIVPEARRREIAERETVADSVHRLYQIGQDRTPGHRNRAVCESDVEWVTTILRRLSLIRFAPLPELIAYAAEKSAADTNEFAHLADPFLIRHVLTCQKAIPNEVLTLSAVEGIQHALDRRDPAAVRAWFTSLPWPKSQLPRETPAFLKRVVLDRVMAGESDHAPLVFEQAVLDVRLYGVLGWENTRSFYVLLKRLTGAATTIFDAYLDTTDLDSCVRMHEEFGDQRQLAHFVNLRSKRTPATLARLERMVAAAALIRDATRPPINGSATPLREGHHKASDQTGGAALVSDRTPANPIPAPHESAR
jgi:hypothetical protein